MASVMIIGWTRRKMTPSPLTRPIAVASPEVARMADGPVGSAGSDRSGKATGADRDDGGDRQIDAAGDDDEGLSGRDEADDGSELDEVAQMAEGGEAAHGEAGDDPDRHDEHGR